MNDSLLRACCVIAAAALAASPYWAEIRAAAERAAKAVRANGGGVMRWGAVALLLAVASGVQLPRLPKMPSVSAPTVNVETPSVEMQTKVAGIARALAGANPAERAIWASVWEKAAVVVAAPEGKEPVFTDSRSLRGFTVLSLDIAWRRLGGIQPGTMPGLREAVEAVMSEAVGLDVKPVDPEMKRRYVEACRAIAWAGIGRG
ncbi:MAG: hypothetical protein EBS54_02050 [Betaproteobacteria bacterium]|nr:hypothetical protein [Betaproteobacteria bacterium]